MHDLIIRDAKVVDGTGRGAFTGDLAVDAGRISAVGTVDEAGRKTIDVGGRVVAPGFIDIHTHYDVQGFWDTTLSPSPLHGVTTAFAGNCGFSVAPLAHASADYLMRTLARVEGFPVTTLENGVPWNWETTAEFLDLLDGSLSINTGFMVGHTALRTYVMGPEAAQRLATDAEIATMQELLRAGLRSGAAGFSTSWARTHWDATGAAVPSRHANGHEMVELARICKEFPGTSLEFVPNLPGDPLEGELLDLLIDMSRSALRPLNWNAMNVTADTLDYYERRLETGDRARERGAKIVGLVLVELDERRYSVWGGFGLDHVPGWLEVATGSLERRQAMLRDPSGRARLLAGSRDPNNPRPEIGRWDTHTIVQSFSPATSRYEGRKLGDIANEEGKSAFDAFCDIILADELRTYFSLDAPPRSLADWQARAKIWCNPNAMVGGSDAGAHIDSISTYNYATMLLRKGVHEYGLLPLEQAVHFLTQVPAQLYGLAKRGVLAEGFVADFVVFDPDTVGPQPTRIVNDLPGGAERLYGGATGVGHVFVAGEEIVQDGVFTEARPGRVLRSGTDLIGNELTGAR